MIESERIKKLNNNSYQNNDYIIYWMQASQRTNYNHALEYSINLANKYNKPLIVYFGLTDDFIGANLRYYHFMLQGLKEVKKNLEERGIKFITRSISPDKGIVNFSKKACSIVVDKGYLKIQRKWRDYVSKNIHCPLIEVESDVVVPVESASDKEEYAAFTIRRKINNLKDKFLKKVKKNELETNSMDIDFQSLDINNIDNIIKKLDIDKSVKKSIFDGGEKRAKKKLDDFIKNKLDKFPDFRNDPSKDYVSNLSPYLHFGQISPVYIALKINETDSPNKESFLEELIVRRELSMNFVFYNKDYDSISSVPGWAKNTLKKHEKDKREYIYSLDEFEEGDTHDPYWNAAQIEMVKTGKMHGYMRMYWGKKIIEWTEKPEDAFDIAIYLNNKYELDGRDPNGYTGVAWCFGKHDRAWKERSIFGKVRYMNAKGLQRKFDIDSYAKKFE